MASRSVVLTINLCGCGHCGYDLSMLLTAANTCHIVEGLLEPRERERERRRGRGRECSLGGANLHKTLEAGKWKMSIEAAVRAGQAHND